MVLSARSVDRGSAMPMSSPPCIYCISATRALHHLDVQNFEINCQKLDLPVPLNSALVPSAGRYSQLFSGRTGPCILSLCQRLLPVWCFCSGRRGHKPRLRTTAWPSCHASGRGSEERALCCDPLTAKAENWNRSCRCWTRRGSCDRRCSVGI